LKFSSISLLVIVESSASCQNGAKSSNDKTGRAKRRRQKCRSRAPFWRQTLFGAVVLWRQLWIFVGNVLYGLGLDIFLNHFPGIFFKETEIYPSTPFGHPGNQVQFVDYCSPATQKIVGDLGRKLGGQLAVNFKRRERQCQKTAPGEPVSEYATFFSYQYADLTVIL